jgi:hypothetical protein
MDLFDYLWNQTFSQIEQKIDHLDQNGQWFISGMSKQVAQSKITCLPQINNDLSSNWTSYAS